MNLHRALVRALLAVTTATVLAACASAPRTAAAPAPEPAIAPSPALRAEGLPPLPQRLLAPIQRWTAVSGHNFVDWHPVRREMLVSHRPPGASTTQLFRVRAPLAVPEPLTDATDPVTMANWEPRDGRYIVFARGSGGNEAFQLYRLDPATRAVTLLTDPDQRHALQAWVKSISLAVVTSVPLDRTAVGGRRSEITTTVTLVDPLQPAARRVVAQLPGGGWFGAEVSPDERQLAITRYLSASESEVWLIDLEGGQRRRLLPAAGETLRASHFVAEWTPDGRALLLTSDRAGEFRELMQLELAGSTLTRLSAGISWDTGGGTLSADGRWLAFTANVDGRDELRLRDRGAEHALPRLPGGSVGRIAFHRARAELALVVNSAQGPAQVHSVDMASGAVQAWTRPTADPALDLARIPDQQIVRWRAFDGRTISGVLTLPPARYAGPRPVVMAMHGGPESQAKQGWQGRLNFLVQELGVAVLEPNVRGSSGYGKSFLALDNGRLREDSVKDMGSAIDWVATQPRLDAKRVLVSGGSYGGYMALAASVRLADRIAGAVSVVGISNFVSFLENTESYRRDLRRVEYGDERDPAMRAFLQGISPLNLADNIGKPLFVVQGKNDPRVPWTESEQIVRRLQARGTPVWYLLADNEGHGFARRENADFYFAALATFIEQTLLR
ncbi:MAG: prolyl oligopeptidase family serine peptidase [Rubrivivax sp.]|nr:prolyl oligopeptidase family serine peptidase [Rubrivivax sp.]